MWRWVSLHALRVASRWIECVLTLLLLTGAFMALDMVFRLRGQLSRKAKSE